MSPSRCRRLFVLVENGKMVEKKGKLRFIFR
jgi:hypothetical protein